MSENFSLFKNPFKNERVEIYFDKLDNFIQIFSPIPFEIGEIRTITGFNDFLGAALADERLVRRRHQ